MGARKTTVWVVMHYEVFRVEPEVVVDSVQFHVASSRKKADAYIRDSWVNSYSWWQVHPYVVDFDYFWIDHEEVYYCNHRGKPLRAAPYRQAICAYRREHGEDRE